jgi:flavin-dependent dehydrogenase
MSEIGSVSLPFHPAFQIDRKRIDGDLAQMNAADGVHVRRGAKVRDIELGKGGAPHHFTAVEDGGRQTRYEARWLVDASGRAKLISRLEGLGEPESELLNASVWGRYEGVTDIDSLGPDSFHSRIRYSARRLSTVHFLYPGYWIWFIPLRDGVTSVGLVCERHILKPEMRTQEGFQAFLRSHTAAASLLENAKPVDHGCYMQLAYKTTRFFSADRYGLIGEAACFTDPFYSPGSDFMALENDFLTDLIQRDHDGRPEEEQRERTRLYDEFMLFRQEATFALYRHQYSLLGSYETCKLKWDLDIGSYYNLWVDAYMRDQHLDPAWLANQIAQRPYVLRALENFQQLFATVEKQLLKSGDYYRRNLGEYNDGRDCLGFLHQVGRTDDVATTLARTAEIFNRVRSDAHRILGNAGEQQPVPLARFLGRRPL